MATVGDVRAALAAVYPSRWAESWDVVGPVCGDADSMVSKVLLAIDPTHSVVDEALSVGAQLIVAHHPLHLRGITAVQSGSVLERLLQAGIALETVHTNGDVARPGTSDSLWCALGLDGDPEPIERSADDVLDLVHVYVPAGDRELVAKAMAAAGAGQVADYSDCAYWVEGTGQFLPLPGASPSTGSVGELSRVAEVRLEMVSASSLRHAVVAALLAAHPYEQPAYGVTAIRQQHRRGFGRIGDVTPRTLAELAAAAVSGLPTTAVGARVAGDPSLVVSRIAVAAGAGDDAIESAAAQGAHVLVTSDLRHHRTRDALDLGLALIDVAHWAAEWPWLQHPARVISEGTNVEVAISTVRTDPWTHNCTHQGASE